MAGFVEIAKIVIKIGFWALIVGLIVTVLTGALTNLAGIIVFLNGISSTFLSLVRLVYNVLYYYTGGAFEYIYVASMGIIITKVLFWSTYWIFQGYEIVTNWLMK